MFPVKNRMLMLLEAKKRAAEAQSNGWFDWETFTIDIPQRKGGSIQFSADEGVRAKHDGLRPLNPTACVQEGRSSHRR